MIEKSIFKDGSNKNLTHPVNSKGITLIALIITIIVMLILVAVSISIALNSGLFDAAGKATQKTNIAKDQEQELASGKVNIDNKVYNSIDEYIATIGGEEKPDRSDLNIGDYVNYTPKGTVYVRKYTDSVLQKYSGYSSNQEVYLQDTKWRILDINSDGSIELISEKELYIGNSSGNTTELYFKGATGYNNGVKILNDLCHELYGTGEYAIGGRSLDIEDIQDRMDTDVWNWEDYENSYVDTGKYGGTKTYETSNAYYPARWAQEVTGKVNGASTNGTLEQSDDGELIAWDETTNAERKGLTYFPEETTGASITITQTYWNKCGWTGDNFTDPTYYNLLITHEDGTNYNNWLASRYVYANNSNIAAFGLRNVYNGYVSGSNLFFSNGYPGGYVCYGVRPVVTLDSKVLLTEDVDNSTEDVKYWKLPENS